MPANKTEEQKYSLVRKYDDFEIRFYPSATVASIRSDAKTYRELAGPGFQKLAGYIFGGNEANAKISMTAPVQMDINDTGSTMSFVMPSDPSSFRIFTLWSETLLRNSASLHCISILHPLPFHSPYTNSAGGI